MMFCIDAKDEKQIVFRNTGINEISREHYKRMESNMEHLTRIQKIAARLFAMFLMVILVTESGEFSEVFTYARTLKINLNYS